MEALLSEKENSGEIKQEGEEDTPLYGFILAMNDDQPGSVKRIFGIKKNEVNIGRGSRNDIRLNARMFSRLHATINISRDDDGTLKVQLKNQSEQKNATRAPYVLPVGNSVILDSPSMFFLQGRRFQWMEHDGNLEKVGALCSNPIYYICSNMKLGKDVSEGESKPATNVVEYVTSPKQELTPKKVVKSGRRRRSSSNPSLDLRKEAIRRSYRASIAQSLNQSAPVLPRIEEAGDSRDEDANASCDLIQFPADDDDSQTLNGSIHDASTQQIVEFGEEESQTPETQNAEEKTPATLGSPRRSSRRPSVTSASPAVRSSTNRRASSRRASMVHSLSQSVSGMNESGDVSNLDCSVSSAIVNLFSEAENGQQMQESVTDAETQVIEDDAGEKHETDVKEVLESSSVTVSAPSTPKRSHRVSRRNSNVVEGAASPMPTPVAASPKPTPVAASPKPASVAASPKPTPVPASPVTVQALESVEEEMECQSPGEQTTDTEEKTPSTVGSPRRSIRLTPSVSSPVGRSSSSKRFSSRRASIAQSLNHSAVSTVDESGDTSNLDCSVSSAIVNLFSEAENGQQMQESVPDAETQVIEDDTGEKHEIDVKEASENSSVTVSTPSTPKHSQRVSRRASNVAKGTASPMPTPVAASPQPTTVSATPKRTSVAASAKSTPVAASPKPTPVAASSKPSPVPASPVPVQVLESVEEEMECQSPGEQTTDTEETTPSTVGSPRRSIRLTPSVSSPVGRSSTSKRFSSRRASVAQSLNHSVTSTIDESGAASNLDCSVSSAIVNLFSEAENGQQMQVSVPDAEIQVIQDDAGEKHETGVKEALESSSVNVSTPSTPKRSQRMSKRNSNVVEGAASPMPTSVAASPKPTPVAASPKAASVAASPRPTPVPASPVPVQVLESVEEEMEGQSPEEQTTDTEETTPSTFGSPRRSTRLTPSVSSPVGRSSTSKRFSSRRASIAQSLNHSAVSTVDESGEASKLDCSVSSAIVNLFSEAENGQQMQESVPDAETQVIEDDAGEKHETGVKEALKSSSVTVSTSSTPKRSQRVSRRNSNVAEGAASQMPTPVAASPKPTSVAASPKPTPVVASPRPTPVPASPAQIQPTTVSATPKRTSVAASAKSTPVAASPKPAPVTASPKPAPVAASSKPSPVPASPVPVQVLESVEEEMECQSPAEQTTDKEEKTPSTVGSTRRSIGLNPSVSSSVGRSSTSKRFSSRRASVAQSLNHSVGSTIDESGEASNLDCSVSSAIVNLFSEAENGQQMQESVPDAETQVIEDDAGEKHETDVKEASENSSVTVSTSSTPKHSQRVSRRASNVAKGTASPMPTPVAVSPKPTPVVAASPKPTPVVASPRPTPVAASPKPTPSGSSPVGRSSTSKRFSSRRASVAQSLNHSVVSTIDERGEASKLDCSVSSAIVNLFSEAENGQQSIETGTDAATSHASKQMEEESKENVEVAKDSPVAKKRSKPAASKAKVETSSAKSPLPKRGRRGVAKIEEPEQSKPGEPKKATSRSASKAKEGASSTVETVPTKRSRRGVSKPQQESPSTEESVAPRRSVSKTEVTPAAEEEAPAPKVVKHRGKAVPEPVPEPEKPKPKRGRKVVAATSVPDLPKRGKRGASKAEEVVTEEPQIPKRTRRGVTPSKQMEEESEENIDVPKDSPVAKKRSKRAASKAKDETSSAKSPLPKRGRRGVAKVEEPETPKKATKRSASKAKEEAATTVETAPSKRSRRGASKLKLATPSTEEPVAPKRSVSKTEIAPPAEEEAPAPKVVKRRGKAVPEPVPEPEQPKPKRGRKVVAETSVPDLPKRGKRGATKTEEVVTEEPQIPKRTRRGVTPSKQMEEESKENIEVAKDSPVAKKRSKPAASKAKEETSSAKSPLPKRGRRGVAKIEEPEQSKPETPKKATKRSASKSKEEASSTVETAPLKRSTRGASKATLATPSTEEPVAPKRSVSKTEVAPPAEDKAPAPKLGKRRGKAVSEPVPEPEQPKPKRGRKVVEAAKSPVESSPLRRTTRRGKK